MKIFYGLSLAAVVLGGCATVRDAERPATMNFTAHVALRGPSLGTIPDVPRVAGQRVDARTIRATLDAYGSWIESAQYGYVWEPSPEAVGASFAPYGSNGQWVETDAGSYWQSGYSWGWLPFHYGRWVQLAEGWAWVPGALFAPAWVDWRTSGGWVGWAPLPPVGAVLNAPYAFCAYGSLYQPDFWRRAVYGAGAASLYGASVAVLPAPGFNGAVYAWGPTQTRVEAPVPIAHAWQQETAAPRSGYAGGSTGAVTAHPGSAANGVVARDATRLPLASALVNAPRPGSYTAESAMPSGVSMAMRAAPVAYYGGSARESLVVGGRSAVAAVPRDGLSAAPREAPEPVRPAPSAYYRTMSLGTVEDYARPVHAPFPEGIPRQPAAPSYAGAAVPAHAGGVAAMPPTASAEHFNVSAAPFAVYRNAGYSGSPSGSFDVHAAPFAGYHAAVPEPMHAAGSPGGGVVSYAPPVAAAAPPAAHFAAPAPMPVYSGPSMFHGGSFFPTRRR